MRVREVPWGFGRFVGRIRSGLKRLGRVEPVGEVPVGLFAGVWAGLAELGESADTGEGGEVEVGPRPSGGEAQDQFSSVVHDPLRAV